MKKVFSILVLLFFMVLSIPYEAKASTASNLTVKPGESYIFHNKSKVAQTVSVPTMVCVYYCVAYDKSGAVTFQSTKSPSSFNIPANGNVVVTVPERFTYDTEYTWSSDSISAEVSKSPAFLEKAVKIGSSYTLTNNSKHSLSMLGGFDVGGNINLVIYNKNGSVKSQYLHEASIENEPIPAGGRAVITVESSDDSSMNALYVNVPYLYFTGKDSASPAMLEKSLNVGKSYEFINKSRFGIHVSSCDYSKGTISYVVYKKNGHIYSSKKDASDVKSIYIPAGGKVSINVTKSDLTSMTFGAPYKYCTGKDL